MVSPGILLVDKPAGLTSHDVVARTRRALGTRKVCLLYTSPSPRDS